MAKPNPITNNPVEDGRKGGIRSGEVRRERGKSFRQRLAEKMDERAEQIAEQLLAAGVEDWRAIIASADQAYGKVPQAVELSGPDGEPIEVEHKGGLTLADVARFAHPDNGPDQGPS